MPSFQLAPNDVIELPPEVLARILEHVPVSHLFDVCILVNQDWCEVIKQFVADDDDDDDCNGMADENCGNVDFDFTNIEINFSNIDDDAGDVDNNRGDVDNDIESPRQPTQGVNMAPAVSARDVEVVLALNYPITDSVDRRKACPMLWEFQKGGYLNWRSALGDSGSTHSPRHPYIFQPSPAVNALGIIRLEGSVGDVVVPIRKVPEVAAVVGVLAAFQKSVLSRTVAKFCLPPAQSNTDHCDEDGWTLHAIAFPRSALPGDLPFADDVFHTLGVDCQLADDIVTVCHEEVEKMSNSEENLDGRTQLRFLRWIAGDNRFAGNQPDPPEGHLPAVMYTLRGLGRRHLLVVLGYSSASGLYVGYLGHFFRRQSESLPAI